MKLILDNPTSSIMELGGGKGKIFDRRFIPYQSLRGSTLSLNQVENKIIRPEFREPRIHFAVVCAAKSCPPLRSEAFVADRLGQQLNSQTRAFIRNTNFNRYDTATNTLSLSRIFEWYSGDFGRGDNALATYVARYIGGDASNAIKANPPRIEYLDYDWSLNGR